jgi:Kef-type K+ transport system membrane component KefB
MMIGAAMVNLYSKSDTMLEVSDRFTPPLFMLFFVLSGAALDFSVLITASVVGVVYVLTRVAGKIAGATLGAKIEKCEPAIVRWLGLTLIPQAGVAIGLAALGARELGGEMGHALETIILSSSVLYELIGPGAAKLSLWLSGSYSNELESVVTVPETTVTGEKKTELELLIERIQAIQSELPAHTENENEKAFTEAAEEYYREQTQPQAVRSRRPGPRKGLFF